MIARFLNNVYYYWYLTKSGSLVNAVNYKRTESFESPEKMKHRSVLKKGRIRPEYYRFLTFSLPGIVSFLKIQLSV